MITIKRAAELTGVPEATLRIWERRYGIGAPHRSEGGYRLYDAKAIQIIQQMKERVAAGWSPHQAAADVLATLETSTSTGTVNTYEDLSERFIHAVIALDDVELSAVMDAAFAQGSFEHVVDMWLAPTLERLGRAWLTDDIDIAAEHFASHAVMRRLSAAFEAAGQTSHGPGVLIGSPAGSTHEIGSLAFATAVRRQGIHVMFLGADVPSESWVKAVQRHTAQAVVISVPTSDDVAPAQTCVDALRRVRPRILVAVGGAHATAVTGASLVLTGGVAGSSAMLRDRLA